MKKDHSIKFLKYSMQGYIRGAVPDKFLVLAYLRKDWPAIVGKGIAHHSLPGTIRNGCLTVNVDDPMWIQELTLQKDSIRENIAAHYKDKDISRLFQTIRFRIGDIISEIPAEEKPAEMRVDGDTMKKIEKSVSVVEDPELRSALKKYLLAASLKEEKK